MAKKFNFRLNPVLKLRTHEVGQARQELGEATKSRSDKEDVIIVKQRYYNEFISIGVKSSTISTIQTKFHHREFLQDEMRRLEEERIRLVEIEEVKKHHLSQSMKKEKILEKLKQKRQLTHREEVMKEEVKTMDEIAMKRHNKLR